MAEKTLAELKRIGEAYLAEAKYAEALKHFQEMLKMDPTALETRLSIAQCLDQLGKKKEAIIVNRQVAEMYAKQGEFIKAIRVLKTILALDKGHKSTQILLSKLYSKGKSLNIDFEAIEKKYGVDVELQKFLKDNLGQIREMADEVDFLKFSNGETHRAQLVDDAGLLIHLPARLTKDADLKKTDYPGPAEKHPETVAPASYQIDWKRIFSRPIPPSQPVSRKKIQFNIQNLPNISFFSDLPEAAFISLIEKMDFFRYPPNQIIIHQGDTQNKSCFLLAAGWVKVFREKREIAILKEGAFFGEMALFSDYPRSASVKTLTDCEIFELSYPLFVEFTKKYPAMKNVFKKFHKERLLDNFLMFSPLFKPFDEKNRRELIKKFKILDVNTADILLKENQNADGLYVIMTGAFDVFSQKGEKEVKIGVLRPGEIFGETSLLNNTPAMASVKATSPGHTLWLTKKVFNEVILTHPMILENLFLVLEERKARNIEKMGEAETPADESPLII